MTLKAGIERILKDRVEGVTEVVNVGEDQLDEPRLPLSAGVLGVVIPLAVAADAPPTPPSCSTPPAPATGARWPA